MGSRQEVHDVCRTCKEIDKSSISKRRSLYEWGGDWPDRKDYQHFEISTAITEILYPNNK
ncbi:M15 family metallopeptidase [Selenomonas sp. AE3005]|uniref:M15 family metallopeptidase n=1 Tax=Selenomonas sp. AE3005 TaxID=1485543 RepID=UPI0009079B16